MARNRRIRTIEEINEKIKEGSVVAVTAEEMGIIVEEKGPERAAEEVDVVTTGTFGAMCSSGAFLNFGHSDPPIKMERVTLNGVEAYHGNAAVDCYIGATKMDPERPFEYGGGHVIEDLVAGKTIHVEAEAYGTDCYPRRRVETDITIEDLNQAILCNPRNAYQRYNAATNSGDEVIYTYMGKLLPDYGNASFSGSGLLSPLSNDPDYETIGVGTRIFLGGGIGYIIGEGTQHDPKNRFGTLMVKGDLKRMNPRYLRGASFTGYGTSLYVGIGVPIPILNVGLAEKTGLKDEDIWTDLLDYGVPRRVRPVVKRTNYGELKSGKLEVDGREIPVQPLSSLKVAREIAETLKEWILSGVFYLSEPVERLPLDVEFKPMKVTGEPEARMVMESAVTCSMDEDLREAAEKIVRGEVNHILVTDEGGYLKGIVTSFDVTRAVAEGFRSLKEVMTTKVITVRPEELLGSCIQKMEEHKISALPVVDKDGKVMGIVTAEGIAKALGRRRF
ncbi:MAG: homocysteine biosynthesis protein [Candidatus Bathyarchaeia archaeon]